MSEIPPSGEYGLPNEIKFGDQNVPSKITEHYEAPANSREIFTNKKLQTNILELNLS